MKQQYIDAEEIIIKGEEENFNLKKWLARMLRAWPWFLLSLLIFLAAGYLYLRYTNPVYKAVASVMVKDEKRGSPLMDNSSLDQIGLSNNSKLVENEIEILRSYDLMEAVVKKMQLYISAKNEGRIRDIDAFDDDLPFIIEIINPESIKETRHWAIADSADGVLFRDESDKRSSLIQYGTIYNSHGIRFRCSPNVYYTGTPQSAGKTAYKIDINLPASTAAYYNGNLSVNAASKSATVINLEMKDTHKKRAAAVLQTLISIYNQRGLEDKNKMADNTIDFLNERLLAVSGELQGVEGSVEKFKSQNKVTDLSNDAEQYLALSQQIDIQKAQSQTQLNIVNALEKELQQNQDNPKLVPSTLGIGETSLGQLIEQHNQLILQKERIQENSGPKNPLLLDLQNQISQVRSKLLSNVTSLKQAYTIALNDISLQDAQLNSRIRNIPLLEKRLVQITRNQNVQEQLYSFLLQKREEAAVNRASNVEDTRVIVQARSLGVISPRPNMIWAFAILIGLAIPAGAFSVKDFMNNKIGDATQVMQNADEPLLGVISHVKKFKSPVLINAYSRSAVAEQIRNIRTAISFTGKGQTVKTILVTSFQPGDGKSFFSLNLAAGYALLDRKTVILEFDLRKPHVTKDLGLDAQEGISSILSGKASLEDMLVEIPGYNGKFFLLPAGYQPPNPAELISGPNMPFLVNMLREQFDHIIIDTPPFSLVSDAALLQQYADITLIVLRQDHTSKIVYSELKQRKHRHPDKPTYLLLNDVGKKKRYDSEYGYGYDISSNGNGKGYYIED